MIFIFKFFGIDYNVFKLCRGNHRYFKISAGSETYEKGTIYKLSKIILHPYYNESEFKFDIAILKVLSFSVIININNKQNFIIFCS